jgi:phosphoribosyl-ATP pyrophosphohydrolase/phosphoribosyl-AMP cyclohydrolase
MQLDFDKTGGLIPAVVQDAATGKVLMLGYMNPEAYEKTGKAAFLDYLKEVIRSRRENPSEKSYTASLFAKGLNKVAQKVGEEAVELVIEAKDNNDELFKNEAADLLFHYLVLLEQKNVDLDQVIGVLQGRHK